jgi:hypothetical protein
MSKSKTPKTNELQRATCSVCNQSILSLDSRNWIHSGPHAATLTHEATGPQSETPTLKTIEYFAVVATEPDGTFAQLRVVRVMSAPGVLVSKTETYTGVTYKSMRAANADLDKLNNALWNAKR